MYQRATKQSHTMRYTIAGDFADNSNHGSWKASSICGHHHQSRKGFVGFPCKIWNLMYRGERFTNQLLAPGVWCRSQTVITQAGSILTLISKYDSPNVTCVKFLCKYMYILTCCQGILDTWTFKVVIMVIGQ